MREATLRPLQGAVGATVGALAAAAAIRGALIALTDHGGAQFLGTIAGVILGTGLGTYLVLRRAQYLRPLLGGGAAAALVPVLAFLLLWAAPVIPALAGLCGTYLVVRMSPSPDA